MFRLLYICHEVTQFVVMSCHPPRTSSSFFQIHGPHKQISPLRPALTTELNENCIIFKKMATLFLQLMRGSRGCLSFITFLALNL